MKIPVFTNLFKNKGDPLHDLTLLKVPLGSDLPYKYYFENLPDSVAATIQGGFVWAVWNESKEKPLESLKKYIDGKECFSKPVKSGEINLIDDRNWQSVGYNLLKKSLINEAYSTGAFFKDDDGKLCYVDTCEEKKGRELCAALKMKFYRNTDKTNFYVSLDINSSIQQEDNPPEPWKDDEYIFGYDKIKPGSSERYDRLNSLLDCISKDGKITLILNGKEVIFEEQVSFPNEVNRL